MSPESPFQDDGGCCPSGYVIYSTISLAYNHVLNLLSMKERTVSLKGVAPMDRFVTMAQE